MITSLRGRIICWEVWNSTSTGLPAGSIGLLATTILTGATTSMEPARIGQMHSTSRFTPLPISTALGSNMKPIILQRSWAQSTFGYEVEDENGYVGTFDSPAHGYRVNQAAYGQEIFNLNRLSVVVGGRFVHNETFGNKGVPRVAVGYQVLRGNEIFSGTRLRFSYATGIKEAGLDQSFINIPGVIRPNPDLKAEENRAFEAGFQQGLFNGKYSFTATYYNNLFHNQIDFAILDFNTFEGQYQNIDKALAHGAELELQWTDHNAAGGGCRIQLHLYANSVAAVCL